MTRRRPAGAAVDDLPFDDDAVESLDDEVRAGVAQHWLRRARSEARIGRAFTLMVPELVRVGAHSEVTALAELAADDEARHAAICRTLAGHYAGAARPVELDVGDVELPCFGCADARLEVALLVLGTACVNETLATAWLQTALAASCTPLATAANRAHLREEIDHARLGWAHLASPAVVELRDALSAYLVPMLEANVPLWEQQDPFLPDDGVPGHGIPATGAARAAIARALRDVVLPGFAHVGLDIGDARRWLATRRAHRPSER